MVPAPDGGGGRRAVRQRPAEVLAFEDLAEALRAPVRDQVLQPRLVAQPPVAVVAEDADDPGHTSAASPAATNAPSRSAEVGAGGQPAAHPQVVPGAEFGVQHPDERDVVDLVDDVLAGVAGDGGLELAREVRELGSPMKRSMISSIDRRRVQQLVARRSPPPGCRARPAGCRRTPRSSAARRPPDGARSRARPRRDPVQLHVLPVGDVGAVAGELRREVRHDPQLPGGQGPAVEADPEHEVLVGQFVRASWAVRPPSMPGARCV